ncbi:MAG: NADH-quinone oxidoreductase subunit NuoI [Acidobacteria bacterium]|nr:NADH-quinone oxidoreductase subunit NuoI [Acidobacteriota bacterium]
MIVVRRPRGLARAAWVLAVVKGMWLTFRHIFRRKVTLQYPEQRDQFGDGYRGLPALVRDQNGREKCVACFLCQWVCPPLAIQIKAGELPDSPVEKYAEKFQINMLRCIMCGYCEEVCPEQAIFLTREYELTGRSREELIFQKDKLLEIGGMRPDPIEKWKPLLADPSRSGGKHP